MQFEFLFFLSKVLTLQAQNFLKDFTILDQFFNKNITLYFLFKTTKFQFFGSKTLLTITQLTS